MSSAHDRRLDGYRHLTDPARRRQEEAASGLFVVEGPRAVRRLLEVAWPVRSLLVLSARAATSADLVSGVEEAGGEVFVAGQEAMDGIAGFHVHRGVLALAERPAPADAVLLAARSRTAVMVEGVNDHENLGSIFRNAAAFGVDSVILDPSTCDPLYRRAVRVSVGHVLRVPFARLDPWPDGLGHLRRAGMTLVALSPQGAVPLGDIGPLERVGVMIGSEDRGLSASAMDVADVVARIPMAEGADSLNVATAAAIALYHFTCHRTGGDGAA